VAGVHLSLLDGLYIMSLANLVALVPAAPGYLGTFDAAVLLGVRLVAGGTHVAALAYAVVVRFVLFVRSRWSGWWRSSCATAGCAA
jgi:uncharacterized membrane protein YbhN (UPF0104 family)